MGLLWERNAGGHDNSERVVSAELGGFGSWQRVKRGEQSRSRGKTNLYSNVELEVHVFRSKTQWLRRVNGDFLVRRRIVLRSCRDSKNVIVCHDGFTLLSAPVAKGCPTLVPSIVSHAILCLLVDTTVKTRIRKSSVS